MSVESFKMQRDVQAAIQKQIDDAKDEVCKLAVAEFEQRIRKIVRLAALNIADYYSIETMGTNLVITVRLERSASESEKKP